MPAEEALLSDQFALQTPSQILRDGTSVHTRLSPTCSQDALSKALYLPFSPPSFAQIIPLGDQFGIRPAVERFDAGDDGFIERS
jgi:hypothetical protein